MEAGYSARLLERTGKTLEQWVELVRASGPPTEKERRAWLRDEHGMTTNYAWWIAERAGGRGAAEDYDPEALVDALFSGGKAGLRPLYEALLKLGLGLGPDVKASPCKTMVPLYRKHVFAQLKPTTRTRLDLGLALGETPFTDRLLDTGGRARDDRITHRIEITRPEDIDEEVRRWLRAAYDRDSGEARQEGKARKEAPEVSVPEDLAAALAANPSARARFEGLPASHRREYVTGIEGAKKAQTRARRVAQAVAQLAEGKTA
jgi:hypothetical protein